MHVQRIVSLDGLRGLAALGVALPHYLLFHKSHAAIVEPIAIVAVEIFFVLSGFVLAPQILYCLSDKTQIRLPIFILRRWMRTLPPYFLALSVIGIMTGHFLDGNFFQHLFFLQNLFSIDDKTDFFPPAWSLSVEEWFYVLFPIYLVLMNRLRAGIGTSAVLFCLIFLIAKIVCWLIDPELLSTARRLVVFRLDAICVGFLLFVGASSVRERRPRTFAYAGMFSLVASTLILVAIFGQIGTESRGLALLIFLYAASAFGASLIALAWQCEGLVRMSGTGTWIATWLGRVSYSVYLFHMPLIVALLALGWQGFSGFCLYVVLLLAVCAGIYIAFERPILAARPQYLSAEREALLEVDLQKAGVRKARQTLFAAIGIIFLVIVCMSLAGERLVSDPRLFNLYHAADALFFVGAVLLMFSALLHGKSGYTGTSRAAMIASGVLLSLVLTDQYILNFRYDTSGPGGPLVTHANWRQTFVKNNSLGFWERELPPGNSSPKESLTIAATGRSFTWGQGVLGAEHRFTRVLENSFREGGFRATVLNFTPARAASAIAAMDGFRPDVVLLCFTLGDVDPLDFLDWRKFRPHYGLQRISVLNPTVNFLVWKFIAPRQYQLFGLALHTDRVLTYTDEAAFNKLMNGIVTMADQVRAIGAKPVYVVLPYPHLWGPFKPEVRETIRKKFKQSLETADISSIDLSPIDDEFTSREFEVNPMDAHPNERMHELIGRRLYDRLLPLLSAPTNRPKGGGS